MIEFKNIDLTFDEKKVFNGFSMSVDVGEKVLITGKSGSGKSTLLSLLLGFADLDGGEIYIQDKLLTHADISETRKLFAYVNQDVTIRPGKAADVLKQVASFSGNDYEGGFDEELARLFEFDLSLLNKDTQELSGGERQRLGIILAIMLDRPVFLLDEVTSALDKNLKAKVADYFAECDNTVVSISHDREWTKTGKFRKAEW